MIKGVRLALLYKSDLFQTGKARQSAEEEEEGKNNSTFQESHTRPESSSLWRDAFRVLI